MLLCLNINSGKHLLYIIISLVHFLFDVLLSQMSKILIITYLQYIFGQFCKNVNHKKVVEFTKGFDYTINTNINI